MGEAEKIYAELIAPIEERMMATVARIVRDPEDVADVFQDVLAVIWTRLRRIHRHENPHAYIMRICVSRSYDALRHRARKRRREVSFDGEAKSLMETKSDPSQENPGKRSALNQAIQWAVGALPPNQAQAVLLRLLDGESYDKIGQILGCSEATARSHVSKGRVRLRVMLAEAGYGKS